MTFINDVLPLDVAPRAAVSPEFRTTIKTLRSGGEARNRQWQNPLRSFGLRYNVRSMQRVRDEIVRFAFDTGGAHVGFRARDWSDYEAAGEHIAVGDGSTYWFRLTKRYGTYERRILKPDPATVTITLDDEALSADEFVVEGENGLVIFAEPPRSNTRIAWSGEFHVPVRFDDDITNVMMMKHDVAAIEDVGLREIRLREMIDLAEIDRLREYLTEFDLTDLDAMFDILDIHVNTNWPDYG